MLRIDSWLLDQEPSLGGSSQLYFCYIGGGGGFGLEEIGIPGRDYLREALTSCTDPLKVILIVQFKALNN